MFSSLIYKHSFRNCIYRLNLQSWLPAEYHPEINHMLVGFGQARYPAFDVVTGLNTDVGDYRWFVFPSGLAATNVSLALQGFVPVPRKAAIVRKNVRLW